MGPIRCPQCIYIQACNYNCIGNRQDGFEHAGPHKFKREEIQKWMEDTDPEVRGPLREPVPRGSGALLLTILVLPLAGVNALLTLHLAYGRTPHHHHHRLRRHHQPWRPTTTTTNHHQPPPTIITTTTTPAYRPRPRS